MKFGKGCFETIAEHAFTMKFKLTPCLQRKFSNTFGRMMKGEYLQDCVYVDRLLIVSRWEMQRSFPFNQVCPRSVNGNT